MDDTQRIGNTPEVTSSTNPTSPNTVTMAPKTHQRNTRNNTPMATLPIARPKQPKRRSPRLNPEVETQEVATTPNVNRIPMATPNIISQEALNTITDKVWDDTSTQWTPRDFMEAYPTEIKTGQNIFDVDIEHFCAAVVHPDTGETITKYKVLANDKKNPTLRETWRTAFGKEVGRIV